MFQKIYHIIFLFLLITISNNGIGQNPLFKAINTSNGLPNNTIYDLIQDKQGYIWMGTDKGLMRHDGMFFKNYPIVNGKSLSLSNILEGPDGHIYCQDFIGNNYVTQNDSLKIIEALSNSLVYIRSYFIGNKLCKIAFNQGLIVYDIVTQKKEVFDVDDKVSLGRLPACDGRNFYYNTKYAIYKYDGKQVATLAKLNNQNISYLFIVANKVFGLYKDNENIVYEIVGDNVVELKKILPKTFIQNISVVKDEVWISSTSGNYCYTSNFTPKYNEQALFEDKNCSSVYIDREDNYWFTTLNEGALICPNLDVNLFVRNQKINTIYKSNNTMFLGTYNNEVLDYNSIKNDTKTIFKSDFKKEINFISYNELNNNLLISSDKLYSTKNNTINNQFLGAFKSATYIVDGLCAFATSEGIILKYTENLKTTVPFKFISTDSKNSWFVSNLGVRSRSVVYNNINKHLYYANAEGLFYVNKDTIAPILDNNTPIIGFQLLFDNNKIYVSSLNNGIYIIEDNKIIQHLTINDGLIDNNITKFVKYKNNLWVLCEKGVQKFDEATKLSTIYNESDGIPNEEIKDLALNDSILFLATNVGLVSFNYKSLAQTAVPPLIALNSFIVNNKNIFYKENVSFKESNIDIDFSVLSFKTNNNLIVEYKINNGEWLKLASKSRTLNLPSLSPGEYTIIIRVINENNIISDKPLVLKFTIKTPFYKSWWFILIGTLLLFALLYSYYLNQIKRATKTNNLLQDKMKLEKELYQSTLSSIKSQMNPHFIFNALNTIQSYIYTNEKENASLYLGKFSELTRIILDMSNKESVPLNEELKAINLYLELEKLRFEDAISYTVTVDTNLDADNTYLPSMLIQPYIENAIKHGLMHQKNKPMVTVQFLKEINQLKIVIDDNGIGRKQSAEKNAAKNKNHESFALNANKKRLEILNKSLTNNISFQIIDKENESGVSLGTTVIINIPINNKY